MSKVPSKVKAGDTLSAKWLNEVVDCLKDHDEKLLRRRMLKGTGYTVSESAGGTSLTIETPPSRNPLPPPLDVKLNADFQLRIKPKGQCEIDPETGSWDKVAQVHIGRVTNHADINIAVGASAGSNVDGETPSSTAWDGGEWVDMGTLPSLGEDGGGEDANPILVFVKLIAEAGAPVAAEFIAVADKGGLEQEEGVTYIPVGEVSCEMVEGTPRYYIKQHQQGPIELSACPLAQYSGETASSDIDTPSDDSSVDLSSVDRPGIIAAIRAETEEESRGASHWVIADGEVIVPLAHAPYQEEPAEGESNIDTARAGLIVKLATASSVDRQGESNIDTASQWYIENGVLYHPEVKDAETCNFSGDSSVDRPGIITSIGEGAQAGHWAIDDGRISVPPASDGQGGIINGAAWLPDGETTPKVEGGKVYFPRLSDVDVPLANYHASSVDDNAGLICGIERRSDIDSDRISQGMIQLALAAEPSDVDNLASYNSPSTPDATGEISGITKDSSIDEPYIDGGFIRIPSKSFLDLDPRYFLKQGDKVTLNFQEIYYLLNSPYTEFPPNFDW